MSRQNDDSMGESPPSTTNIDAANEPTRGDRTAGDRALQAYGVVRDDAIWVTECAWCTRVRSASGDWHTPTVGTRAAMGVQRTHGICPPCARAAVERAQTVDERRQ